MELKLSCILDSGSPITLMEIDAIPADHPVHNEKLKRSTYTGLGGRKSAESIYTFAIIKFEVKAMNKTRNINAFVVPSGRLPSKLLFGRDSMKLFGLRLVSTESDIDFNPELFPFANEAVLNINCNDRDFSIDSELLESDRARVLQVIKWS